jgi:large subunit ribosomal protein L1
VGGLKTASTTRRKYMRPKKEESAKKKRLIELSARIGEPENIFDTVEPVAEEKIEETSAKKVEEVSETEGEEEVKVAKKPKVKGKKLVNSRSLVGKNKKYNLTEALELVKKASYSKFPGTVEVHIILGDKEQRGTLSLPHGTGKTMKVAAIVPDAKIGEAKEAGADHAGGAELAEQIKSGKLVAGRDFNAVVADPSTMPILAPLAKILGPKGLMPNPKNGTVGPNIAQLVSNLKKGQLSFKAETPNPYLIHLPVGKVNYEVAKLEENINTVIQHFGANKVKKITVSATMAPGIEVTLS